MTPLPALLNQELAEQGIEDSALGESDRAYAAAAIRSLVTRLKTRTSWETHVGPLLTHGQVLNLTNWSKQALSQAVRDHRVIRLDGEGGHAYLLAGFDDQSPARPLPGIKKVFAALAEADPRGWTAAAWLMSPQPELSGQTPRDALLGGMTDRVATLAGQAAARLAA